MRDKILKTKFPVVGSRFKLPVLPQLGLLAVIMLLIFGSGISGELFETEVDERPPVSNRTAGSGLNSQIISPTSDERAFDSVTITAKSAFVWDVSGGEVLYKRNENEPLPLASLTKLMTALLAHEILGESDTITISEMAVKQDGVSGLTAGESFNRQTLSDMMLISSSNDGAYALAYAAGAVLSQDDPANAFVQAMNIRAREIGLTNTYFKNPTGLDLSLTEGGAYGTARDMATLMEYIIEHEPSILAFTKDVEIDVTNTAGIEHEVENTNFYVNEIPGLIGSKTGFTDLAGGNLVVAFEGGLNRPFIVVVMGSTRQDRFSDVITLVEEVKKHLKQT